jgi:hypothetical protein
MLAVDITWQLITIFGGTQVILAALVGFLGKIWTDRIGKNQEADLKGQLALLQHELAKERAVSDNNQKAAFENQLTLLKDELTRKRAVTETERQRVVTHLEKSMSAYADLLVLIRLANRLYWLPSQELVDLERAFMKAFYGLSIQLQILRKIEAVPAEVTSAASQALYKVRDAWDELTLRLGRYKEDSKAQDNSLAKDSWEKLTNAAAVLHKRTSPLEECMEAVPAAVHIPC